MLAKMPPVPDDGKRPARERPRQIRAQGNANTGMVGNELTFAPVCTPVRGGGVHASGA
jgi:hypothetical protein